MYGLFLGGTAALFEEGGRYLVMSLFLKKQRSTSDGIAFGVGHGGIEAILLVGINAVVMLVTQTFQSTPDMIFAGGIERLCTLVIQIAFSVMVMKSVREKNLWWLLLAFVIHTAIDFGAVTYLSAIGVWPLEGAVFVVAVLMAWFVARDYKNNAAAPPDNKNNA